MVLSGQLARDQVHNFDFDELLVVLWGACGMPDRCLLHRSIGLVGFVMRCCGGFDGGFLFVCCLYSWLNGRVVQG